ncbi:AraC family transcriptional regulator [Jiangella rhizosphaerae]|nr:AraC family transcriptional regulator [Jiangella rhizosphaerae]
MDLSGETRPASRGIAGALMALTPDIGPNKSDWPGLTTYRFERPQPAQRGEVHSLSLCYVVQGRKRWIIDGSEYICEPSDYLLFARGMRFESEILEATADRPYLSLVLQVDPAVVGSVSVDLADRRAMPPRPTRGRAAAAAARVSPADQELEGAILRFLRALATASDRKVLAPLYLREAVYRLMRAEQVSRLLHAAVVEQESTPVSEVIRYVREHLSEPLTVAALARHARMSSSTLTAKFTEATGMGPYQFVKRMRLDRAGALLMQGNLNVSEVARRVGYVSLSHFINEFKRHFGTTPRHYAAAQRDTVAMRVDQATAQPS